MSETIRPASLSDVEILLDLVRDFHVFEHLEYDREKIRKILMEIIMKPSLGQVWIVELGPEIAGYALLGYGYSIEYGGRDAFIDEIYLSPAHRKKGIGTRLLQWIETEARKAGISVIHLEVDLENERAFEVYKAFGFKPKNRRMMSLWPRPVK